MGSDRKSKEKSKKRSVDSQSEGCFFHPTIFGFSLNFISKLFRVYYLLIVVILQMKFMPKGTKLVMIMEKVAGKETRKINPIIASIPNAIQGKVIYLLSTSKPISI